MHAVPNAEEDSATSAARVVKEQTGLDCSFSALGGGYFRVYEGDALESFTNFTLLVCEDAKGELITNDSHADYSWVQKPDFSAPEMLPNMKTLTNLYEKGEPFFVEKTLYI